MKGLIIKDFMCLKKQGLLLFYIVLSVLVLSIMFVLSAQFGNVYIWNQEVLLNNMSEKASIVNTGIMVISIFMMLPIAVVGDVSAILIYDENAGFNNVSITLPLSVPKKLLAKYITVSCMLMMGVGIDLLISFVLSLLTTQISFMDLFKIIVSTASFISIYASLVLFLYFLIGKGKIVYVQLLAMAIMALSVVIPNYSKVKALVLAVILDELGNDIIEFQNIVTVIKDKYYMLFGIAILVMIISYFGSIWVAKRKRGII